MPFSPVTSSQLILAGRKHSYRPRADICGWSRPDDAIIPERYLISTTGSDTAIYINPLFMSATQETM